jgi:hypothetical protein
MQAAGVAILMAASGCVGTTADVAAAAQFRAYACQLGIMPQYGTECMHEAAPSKTVALQHGAAEVYLASGTNKAVCLAVELTVHVCR